MTGDGKNKYKVLVVDDVPTNLDVLKGILQPAYTVFLAINGSLALKIADAQAPDLILLDIMMPEIDGYEVCRRLKSDEKTADIPVIFVSAKDAPDDESRGFASGCVDYIKKPFSPAIVLARVETHIALSRARRSLEDQNRELKALARLRDDVERISRHDLKNPLTAIFAGVYILETEDNLGEDATTSVQMISEAAKDMLDMINSSLDMVKMERHMYEPDLIDVDMVDIIRRIERDLGPLISAQKNGIQLWSKEGKPAALSGFTVKGETLMVYSMMANLLKNALEATPGSQTVTVSLEDSQGEALIHIHNPGEIPEPIRDTIFEKFATFGKKKGTGLGTYSAKLIAKTLGGDITMKTSGEQGTTFTVNLAKGDEFHDGSDTALREDKSNECVPKT